MATHTDQMTTSQVVTTVTTRRRPFRWSPWLFLLPAIIVFLLFKYYPMAQAFNMSLYEYSIVRPPGEFVGLQNFIDVFSEPRLGRAVVNTIQLLITGLLLTFWVPILFAILINEVKQFQGVFRVLYFIPAVAPPVVMAVLWKNIWQPDFGIANFVLKSFGLGTQLWLNDPDLAKIALKLPEIWLSGLNLLIFLAALQDIPEEMYEAATVDGASLWQKLRYVTLPFLRPTILVVLILAVIAGLQEFSVPFVMTQGGPAGTTTTISMYIYTRAFRDGDYGFAMAVAILFFLVIMAITYVQLRLSREQEVEES